MIKEEAKIMTGPGAAPRMEPRWEFAPPDRGYPGEVRDLGYSCEVRLKPDETGGYMVHVPQLPGVVSEGDDVADARRNIVEALTLAIETYRQEKMPIPWARIEEVPSPDADEDVFQVIVIV